MEGGEVGAVTLERLDKGMEFTLLVAYAELRWNEKTIKKVQERRGGISWWVGKKGLLKQGVVLKWCWRQEWCSGGVIVNP